METASHSSPRICESVPHQKSTARGIISRFRGFSSPTHHLSHHFTILRAALTPVSGNWRHNTTFTSYKCGMIIVAQSYRAHANRNRTSSEFLQNDRSEHPSEAIISQQRRVQTTIWTAWIAFRTRSKIYYHYNRLRGSSRSISFEPRPRMSPESAKAQPLSAFWLVKSGIY